MRANRLFFAAGLGLALAAGYAIAQTPSQVVGVEPTDLIAVIPGGVGSVPSQYATAAKINGVPGYTYTVPLTAFSLTYANGQTNMALNPAGTLGTGTVTASPNPADGQRHCIVSTQTQTAITWTANTGQTVANGPTALTAMVPVCMTYVKSIATWERSP